MKSIISFLAGVTIFLLLIVKGDGYLISIVLDAIPASAHEWLKLIKIGLWIVAIIFTTGIAFIISAFVGKMVKIILGGDKPKYQYKSTRRFIGK
jgi:membrane protein implicated in regulation of membrane protease activity